MTSLFLSPSASASTPCTGSSLQNDCSAVCQEMALVSQELSDAELEVDYFTAQGALARERLGSLA